jgi:hypothetical protein
MARLMCRAKRALRSLAEQASELAGNARGYIQVEYVIVTLFAGVVVAAAMATVGPRLVESYAARRAVLYAPVP